MKCSLPTCENTCDTFKDGTYKKHCSKRCCAIHNALKSAEKKKETCIEKYGTPHPIGSSKVRAKIKEVINDRYGVANISQLNAVKDKKKNTLLEHYGVDHPLKSDIIKNKIKETIRSRYGVTHVSYIGKSEDTINLLTDINKLTELNKQYSLYSIARQHNLADRTLREIFEKHGITPIYHPGDSSFELEIKDYIKSIYTGNIEFNTKILDGKEVDIYLPDLNLGIECNGAYWHSEIAGKKDKKYHLNKHLVAKDKNIRLLNIWDFEWYNKRDIVCSIIFHNLQLSNKIFARKCKVQVLTKDDESKFFNANHIQGYIYSDVCYGLIYDNDIVSAMSFIKSRYDKSVDTELLRFANKVYNTTVGGASKLLKAYTKNNTDKKIISYSAKNITTGNMYKELGFEYLRTTGPAYYYTKDYRLFMSRISFQKHKLKKILKVYEEELSEWENMKNNGYDRIWDCGNDVWIIKDIK